MTNPQDASIQAIEEDDVRGTLSIGGLLGFFLTLWGGLYMVSKTMITVEELVNVIALVTPVITLGIGYYFGQQSNR
jgi:hypothetical protein